MKNNLTYKKPAKEWTEALPLGNGRIGAMHFGGVEVDHFQLNEDTLWSGPPEHEKQQDKQTLTHVRQLIEAEKYEQANTEAKKLFGPYTEAYMPLGNITLRHLHGNSATNYERKLDMNQALSTVRYQIGDTVYQREAFISHPHQVLAIRLQSSQTGQLNFSVALDSLLKNSTTCRENKIALKGICPEHCAPVYHDDGAAPIVYGEMGQTKAIHFEGRLGVSTTDGEVHAAGNQLMIQQATAVVLYFSVATSFQGYNQLPGKDMEKLVHQNNATLAQAMAKPYETLKEAHVTDYRNLFDRVSFQLEGSMEKDDSLSTDQRVKTHGSNDLEMVTNLFQYGRYLLIAASRDGSQPANLQGIWNDSTRAPWSSNYTMNINTEMNYWPAEVTNLSECHRPLLQAIKELAASGKKMVSERYGLDGWTANHNTDLWRHTSPVGGNGDGDPIWAFWPMSGPWLCRHLWEHYLVTQDKQFLQTEALPLMQGAAMFCLDWLLTDETGNLYTSPSTSPEHRFRTKDGQHGSVTKGATMDLEIIWDLFSNCMEAAEVLGMDEAWVSQVKQAKERLYPLQIGGQGQLQEWMKDYADSEIHHRHVSHLYGLYPGKQIIDGKFLQAAKRTLEIRGDEGTGWSLGWKLCLWARLKDGEHVEGLLRQLFHIVETDAGNMSGGGIYPNLLGAHPPFQIDGNFGYTAGVAELLVQSHKGYVELLPTLPPTWDKGTISGLCIRGGFEISLTWENQAIVQFKLWSKAGEPFRLKTTVAWFVQQADTEKEMHVPEEGQLTMKTTKGVTYTFYKEH